MDKGDRRLRIFTDGKATFGYQLNVGNHQLSDQHTQGDRKTV